MNFYEVLERRRTVRDFSNREVTDDVLQKVLATAFKAPTNDHLRQFEFVVVRGRENIARMVAPLADNIKGFTQKNVDTLSDVMDKDEYAMFKDAMPKQQKMLVESGCLVLPFFVHKGGPLLRPECLSSLNYFASVWAAIENILLAATAEGLACALHIPIERTGSRVRETRSPRPRRIRVSLLPCHWLPGPRRAPAPPEGRPRARQDTQERLVSLPVLTNRPDAPCASGQGKPCRYHADHPPSDRCQGFGHSLPHARYCPLWGWP